MLNAFPFVDDISEQTLKNENYRQVLFTTPKMQLVVMSLNPGENIPSEIHNGSQFIRVEQGIAYVEIENEQYVLCDDQIVIIPGGMKHYIESVGIKKLKLYSIYTPPEHPFDKVDIYQPLE